MNVLVANISKFSPKIEERKYEVELLGCNVKDIKAYHTNESIFKCVIELQTIKDSGGLGKIIALVSEKVLEEKNEAFEGKTSFEYYSSIVKQLSPETQVEIIKLENEKHQENSISTVLEDICNKINLTDTVYIDSAGGKRTTSNIIQILIKLLKYKGVENPYSLYADINGERAVITDTSSFLKMTDLADAFNEFITSGRTHQLINCFAHRSEPEIKHLLSSMTEFSDKVQLGKIEKLDKNIKNLNECIDSFSKIKSDADIEIVILKQFLPVIKEKLLGADETKIDYVKIIQWCLNNSLVQQAITIIVDKLPIYLFEHGIIKYCGDYQKTVNAYKTNKNKMQPADWETNAFYTEILDIQNPLLKEMREYLTNGKIVKNEKCKKIESVLTDIEKTWNQNILEIKIPKDFTGLKNLIEERKYNSFKAFKNDLVTNPRLLEQLLGIAKNNREISPSEDITMSNKFSAIEAISNGYKPTLYVFHSTNEIIVSIYYGYMYAKSLRNQINHASSEDNLTAEQKKTLQRHGFDMAEPTVEIIKKNLEGLLNIIISVEKSNSCQENEIVIIKPTNLHEGDIISATCIDKKIVRISGYDYDIQLVLSKGIDFTDYMNKTFDVRIKQISKVGKIIQVVPKDLE